MTDSNFFPTSVQYIINLLSFIANHEMLSGFKFYLILLHIFKTILDSIFTFILP